MKAQMAVVGLFVALALGPGCATAAFKDPANVQALAQNATYLGATIEIQKNPGASLAFQKAYDALGTLLASGKLDGATLTLILSDLPIKQFQGGNAAIYVQGGALIFDIFTQGKLDINKSPYLQAFAQGVHDGLGNALKLNVPPAPAPAK